LAIVVAGGRRLNLRYTHGDEIYCRTCVMAAKKKSAGSGGSNPGRAATAAPGAETKEKSLGEIIQGGAPTGLRSSVGVFGGKTRMERLADEMGVEVTKPERKW
jgi:hypothetical protein